MIMRKIIKKTALVFLAVVLTLTGCAKTGGESQTKKADSEKSKPIVVSMYSSNERRIELMELITKTASINGDYNIDLRVITDKDMSYDKYLLKLNKELSLGEVDLVFASMERILNLTPSKVNLDSFYKNNSHIFNSLQFKYMVPIFASVGRVLYDQKAIQAKGLDPDWNDSKERALVLSQLQNGDVSLNYTNLMRNTVFEPKERMFIVENGKLVKNNKVVDGQLQWVNELAKSAKNTDWDSFEAEEWNDDERISGTPRVRCENILHIDPVFEFSKGYQAIYQVDENSVYPQVFGAYINNWNEQIETLVTFLVSEDVQMLTELSGTSPAGHVADISPENFKIVADTNKASEYQREIFKMINEETVNKLNREQPLSYEDSYGLMSQADIQYQLLMAYHKNGEAGMNLQVDEWEMQLNEKLNKLRK